MRKTLFFALLLWPLITAHAQNSAKSKSKDRFREKDYVSATNVVAVNSTETDFAPAFFENALVFVSNRKSNGAPDAAFRLWRSSLDASGNPTSPARFPFEGNGGKSIGSVAFSSDFKILFFTQNAPKAPSKDGKEGVSHLKIYMAQRYGDQWVSSGELPFCSNDYDCMNPSLRPDGKRLYFASNKPGGYGGYDIYYADWSGSPTGWSAPVNAGPAVNTESQELLPFISASGALFFSSNGHQTLGGFDLFYTDATAPEEVVNLGQPFNSPANDMGLVLDAEGKKGFFSSDRERGMGKDDLYSFSRQSASGGTTPGVLQADILVTDAVTGAPLQGAAIYLLQPAEDGSEHEQEAALKNLAASTRPELFTNAAGRARTDLSRSKNYWAMVALEGYTSSQRMLSVKDAEAGTLRFALRPLPPCLRAGGVVLTSGFGVRIADASLKFVHGATGVVVTALSTGNGEFNACLPEAGDYIVYVERVGFQPTNFRLTARREGSVFEEVRLTEDK